MKALNRRRIAALCIFAVGIIVAWVGTEYFRYISQRVYESSANYLTEVYGQVNQAFANFLEINWGNLDDWRHGMAEEDDTGVEAFLRGRKDVWSFSQFYFLGEGGDFLSLDGESGVFEMEGTKELLFDQDASVLMNETLPSGQTVTLFAIPVAEGRWRDFTYRAIGISYTNADMLRSLHVEAFAGESVCFVVEEDGSVLLSSQPGGSVFGNYLAYLRAASDLSSDKLEAMQDDWKRGEKRVISCKIGGVRSYLCYQSVGYQGCVLLGVVPEEAASASLLQIQRATIQALLEIFALLGALILAWLIHSNRQQRRKNALELLYREMLFDTLSNSVSDIFVMLDAKTLHTDYLSANVDRLLGIPQEEAKNNIRLLGESVTEQGGPLRQADLEAIPIHGSRQWEREHVHRRSGERRWYRETIYHENIQGMEKFLVVMSDRTQEKQMNEHLQEALNAAKSANKAKSHFLSNMSHDIRTPMNAIIGFSVLLAKEAENPEKVKEYTRKISYSSHHLLSLINDVLDMSKIESGKTSLNVSRFSLPEMMEELHTILLPQAKAKGQSFEIRVEGRPAEELMGDKLRLNQILLNLLSNAVKYTKEGGEIEFLVKDMPKEAGQYAHLSFVVKDNGIGISEEFIGSVFDAFSRESTSTVSGIQGTGLGMAITKNLVELMGGTIGVESKLGEGSVFTVELVFAKPDDEEKDDFWSKRGFTRVLAADDEEDVGRNIQEMMRERGVEVTCVRDGAAAVEKALAAKERGEPFHVILLDWQMPGMGGLEAARQLREKLDKTTPILVLSSYDWNDIEDEARAAGADGFMPKPFFVSTFRQNMEALHIAGAEPAAQERVLEGMLFLVAEDNELNAEILIEMLHMENARCDVCVNGKEALDRFQASAPGTYDMILMDVQMPVMNGYEATRAIRALSHPEAAEIPILAMTANAFAEDVRDALQAGMNAHLSKPIDMEMMKAAISQLRSGSEKKA